MQHAKSLAGREADVIDAVVRWSEGFIEQPHEIFGDLPVCPFARAARLKQTIRFEVRRFCLDDTLEPNISVPMPTTAATPWAASDARERTLAMN